VPAQLSSVTDTAQNVRLEFVGGISVILSRADFDRQKHNKEWIIEFPPQALRVL
jgi:hypothetical protein